VCASTTARQVCNTDGLGFSATACASGQSCNAGACAVRCGVTAQRRRDDGGGGLRQRRGLCDARSRTSGRRVPA
jgi:hypothetical protein